MATQLRKQRSGDKDTYDRVGRTICCVEYWAPPVSSITVNQLAADVDLINGGVITVADLPTAPYTLGYVHLVFRFRKVANGYAGVNKTTGAQAIQIIDAIAGTWTDGILLPDDFFHVGDSATDYYYEIEGSEDVAGEVDAESTYWVQWEDAAVDQDSLTFYDVQVGLRLYYEIEDAT